MLSKPINEKSKQVISASNCFLCALEPYLVLKLYLVFPTIA